MPVEEARAPRRFSEIITDLESLPRENWLFIRKDSQVNIQVMCWEVATDDFTDEEIEEYCRNNNLKSFFHKDQLEDIVSNLQEQVQNPTIEQQEAAIVYYWQHDAFLSVT